jgi:hypothetical protein
VAPDEPHEVLNMTSAMPALSAADHPEIPDLHVVPNLVSDVDHPEAGAACFDSAPVPRWTLARTSVDLDALLRQGGAAHFLSRTLAID